MMRACLPGVKSNYIVGAYLKAIFSSEVRAMISDHNLHVEVLQSAILAVCECKGSIWTPFRQASRKAGCQ